ncbi:MAG TPA: hypothetical protein VNS32_07020 [Flavisolibacter sp.]|nr:hypothetical protein [Flavisolibacter sp.]
MTFERTKIIEIIGVPGVGKSTVYKALCDTYREDSEWIYPDADSDRRRSLFGGISSFPGLVYKKLFGRNEASNKQIDLGLRFVKQHRELTEFIWKNISENQTGIEDVGQRFRAAYFAFKHFCRYQKILESQIDKPCVIEEGLFQKSFLIRNSKDEMLEAVHDYLDLVPLPKAIIYLNTSDANIILERLKSRKKIIAAHKEKNDDFILESIEKWQFLFNDMTENLSSFNVPVYKVDGSKTVKENVRLINHILKNN